MERPVLRISQKRYNEETAIISMRLAKDLIRDIDAVANMTGRSRRTIDQSLAAAKGQPMCRCTWAVRFFRQRNAEKAEESLQGAEKHAMIRP